MELNKLDSLVAEYGAKDEQIKSLKKANDTAKELIKSELSSLNTDKWTAGGFTVTRVESTTDTLNEVKLLALMQNHRDIADQYGLIKTVEYVDTDALESAIYNGYLSSDILNEMQSCHESKTTVALRCTKAKEK